MKKQKDLFNNNVNSSQNFKKIDKNLEYKFKYSLLLSAVGDSLGWYLEFKKSKPKRKIETYQRWKKLVGGKWWGYEDEIKEGEYSDDTQLMLSVARSINSDLSFDTNYFAYLELPLWLGYERGGGKTVKTAARNLLKKKTYWFSNFFKTKDINYFLSGANGVAMRNLPIALVNNDNIYKFVENTIKNSIITHGHPRALIGALNIGYAQIYLLNKDKGKIDIEEFINFLLENLANSIFAFKKVIKINKEINSWFTYMGKKYKENYIEIFKKYLREAYIFNEKIPEFLTKSDEEFYSFTKAINPKYKGSGTSTTAVAIYMFLKYLESPEKIIIETSNFVGSDTDTISSLSGSLLGCFLGKETKKNDKLKWLIANLQDEKYISSIGEYLFRYYSGNLNIVSASSIDKKEALLKIMAWELGLHEMFWDALKEGDIIIHPTLGKGKILEKYVKRIKNRKDYIAKIIYIRFESGQTAYFHSRVSKESKQVKNSLSREIDKILQ